MLFGHLRPARVPFEVWVHENGPLSGPRPQTVCRCSQRGDHRFDALIGEATRNDAARCVEFPGLDLEQVRSSLLAQDAINARIHVPSNRKEIDRRWDQPKLFLQTGSERLAWDPRFFAYRFGDQCMATIRPRTRVVSVLNIRPAVIRVSRSVSLLHRPAERLLHPVM